MSQAEKVFPYSPNRLAYLWKTVWPSSLAVLYPLEVRMGLGTHGWSIASALLLIGGISFLAVRQAPRRPYLLTGWLWYLGTLVPVIGLVQVGIQSMADRYTYIPLIGVFLALTWAAFGFAELRPFGRTVLKIVLPAVVLSLAAAAWNQAGYWRDNVALYSHALSVTENNWKVWHNLGLAYVDLGRNEEAIASFRKVVGINPGYLDAWYNLGIGFGKLSRFQQAIAAYWEAIRLAPDHAGAWNNLGAVYAELGRYEEGIASFREALRINPGYSDAWYNLGVVYAKLGQNRQATVCFQKAIQIRPDHAEARRNLNLSNRGSVTSQER